jgi:hypothetical protein
MNALSGDGPLAWGLVTGDALWAAVFGGAAAAAFILLARRADALPRGPHPERIARPDDYLHDLPAAGRREASPPQRPRSTPF